MAPSRPARLRFVTGKGGVGKSTVAAALALMAAERGDRTLAVDAVDAGDLGHIIDRRAEGRRPTLLGLTTQDSLDEYVRRFLKVPIAPSSLGPLSRIFDFVSNAAPGVKEILTVGKIGYEARYGPWDEIVVDAPASGHVVEILAAPRSLRQLVTSGPLAGQTDWLEALLAGESTTVTVVSTAEELPAAETAILLDRLAAETQVTIDRLIVNRVPPVVDPAGREEVETLTAAPTGRRKSSAGGKSHDRAAAAVLGSMALDRADQARPFVDQLTEIGRARSIPSIIEVPDRPDNPVAAVQAALESAP